jgi:hypothetical protein
LYADRWQGQVYGSNKRGRNRLIGELKKTMFVAAVKKLGATSIGGRPKHIEGGLGVKKQSAHGVTTMPNLI